MPKTPEELEAELTQANVALAAAQARIKEVNDEAKGHRLNADNHKAAADRAAADAASAQKRADDAAAALAADKTRIETEASDKVKAAETKATEATTKAQERVVNADLKIAAKDAGAHDAADVLALIDRSKIKLGTDGEIENAAELIAEMKKAKGHLFGAVTTTSNPGNPPPKKPPEAKSVKDMTDDEFEAARRNRDWRK
jgi:hypothetical protein